MRVLAEPRDAPSDDSRHGLGRLGEEAAAAALVRAGLKLLERRYRRPFGEVDLIARSGELIVFVEVKTRRSRLHGDPAAAVTPRKQARIVRAATDYLVRRGWTERPCRFDVIEVVAQGTQVHDVRHLVDAFRLWPGG